MVGRQLRTCLSDPFAPRSHFHSQEITRVRLAGRMGAEMWTEAHRARHEAGLKEMVSTCAVEEMARWLERADPPRSERATPVLPGSPHGLFETARQRPFRWRLHFNRILEEDYETEMLRFHGAGARPSGIGRLCKSLKRQSFSLNVQF